MLLQCGVVAFCLGVHVYWQFLRLTNLVVLKQNNTAVWHSRFFFVCLKLFLYGHMTKTVESLK